MPRKEINYQNTVIYKIQHTEKDDLLYVGHTTSFTKRKASHKSTCNNPNSSYHNLKVYTMIRENGGWGMFKMLEIKKFPCNDDREACAEEDKCMKELKANMNSRGSVLDRQHRHDQRNSKVECQCGNNYTQKHKSRHQQSQKHKDGIIAQQKIV